MAGNLSVEKLKRMIREDAIDTVLVAATDMQGRLIGKRTTSHFFLDHAMREGHGCDYLLAVDMEMEPVPGFTFASWEKGYGDFVMKPDLMTLRLVPWLPKTALVLCDICDHHGHDLPHSPRAILKRQVARARDKRYVVKTASELEFFLFETSYAEARAQGYRELKTAGWYSEDYHIFQTTKEEGLIRAIRKHMDAAGVPVECSKGEFGPGQEEINLEYAEAVEMADRHAIYKNGAKEIAWQHGKALSFMAKFDFVWAGNSFHLHSSLWDAKGAKALFSDAKAPEGMSKLFQYYLAGQLAAAREMTYFYAPYINSYKRYQSASFAPTKVVWAKDNRTSGFRVVGEGKGLRVECRIPGADANPYLAFAATIAAGLHGIDAKLKLPPKFTGNAYSAKGLTEIPKTLRDAVELLDKSKVLRKAIGDDVIDHYVHAGRWEQAEYDRRITDWERIRYFERA